MKPSSSELTIRLDSTVSSIKRDLPSLERGSTDAAYRIKKNLSHFNRLQKIIRSYIGMTLSGANNG